MAKFSIAMGLAIFFGLASIGLMVSTIILATDDEKVVEVEVEVFNVKKPVIGENECLDKKYDVLLPNEPCYDEDGKVGTVPPQSGADVTKGYVGEYDKYHPPITVPYYEMGLCPVNVHWHLGTEHKSDGQYDEENGTGPTDVAHRRKLAGKTRKGGQCMHYNKDEEMYTKAYDWKHCVDMEVGQTYEVHWPHSMHGACGTPNQYQQPFYDGVFCRIAASDTTRQLQQQIGVQGQVFVIVNDENYYYPDLFKGMIVDGDMGKDIAYYAGSTTGTKRDNKTCSKYGPITWQVDRKCHKISASSFDKMCADMKATRDDMSDDLHPDGSRIVVADNLAQKQEP